MKISSWLLLFLRRKVQEILSVSAANNIPIIFALKRRQLSAAVGMYGRVSVLGILDFGGANQQYETIFKMSKTLKSQWINEQKKMQEYLAAQELESREIEQKELDEEKLAEIPESSTDDDHTEEGNVDGNNDDDDGDDDYDHDHDHDDE